MPRLHRHYPPIPQWRLNPKLAPEIVPDPVFRIPLFSIVNSKDESPQTVRKAVPRCTYPHCGATQPKKYLRRLCAKYPDRFEYGKGVIGHLL